MAAVPCEHTRWTCLFEYSVNFHDTFSIFHCPDCSQHYVLNNWERVDWEDGRDTQHTTLHRITADEVAVHRRLAADWSGARDGDGDRAK